ncbi:MAG: glutaminyl-peptide cyclotransferase [Alistipes sp.]|nr:glutaminyl-peptide cyclotransferase [Alistipes sp.]
MRSFTVILFAAMLPIVAAMPAGCRGNSRTRSAGPTAAEPARYSYRVTASHPHLTTSYTQGLQYIDGVMWEGTGQNGRSRLQKIDLHTGKADVVAELPHSEFGEGIAVLNGEIFQLTWTSNIAHVYDLATGRKLRDVHYTGEGWGLTTDGERLYMSNGSERIFRIDPKTFEREGSITVTVNGEPVRYLNELEWIDGKIWANVYTTDFIVIINPDTGIVEGIVDLQGLLPASETTPETDVLNGIAYDAADKRIFVTGKNWSRLFEIELTEQ